MFIKHLLEKCKENLNPYAHKNLIKEIDIALRDNIIENTSVFDIVSRASEQEVELSIEEAREILNLIKDNTYDNSGVTEETIDYWIEWTQE